MPTCNCHGICWFLHLANRYLVKKRQREMTHQSSNHLDKVQVFIDSSLYGAVIPLQQLAWTLHELPAASSNAVWFHSARRMMDGKGSLKIIHEIILCIADCTTTLNWFDRSLRFTSLRLLSLSRTHSGQICSDSGTFHTISDVTLC